MEAIKTVTAEEIQTLLDEGMTKKEAGVQLEISAQKVGRILADAKKVEAQLIKDDEIPASVFAETFAGQLGNDIEDGSSVVVMTAKEYAEYSEANGRFEGRPLDKKTPLHVEGLRALINGGLKPKYIMNKTGMNAEEFKQLVWKLSKKELRDRPLRFNIEADFIEV